MEDISKLEPFPSRTVQPTSSSHVKRLFFCRHGETLANASNVLQGSGIDQPLNEKGVLQAQCLRERLKNESIDLFVTSNLKRAQQTALIVKEHHPKAEFLEIPALTEISWGDWEGDANPLVSNLLANWEEGDFAASSPNGESPLEVEARATPIIYDLLLTRPDANIVFVVHGRLLRVILSSILYQSLQFMSKFTHHNTCINLIDVIIETNLSELKGTSKVDESAINKLTRSLDGSLDDNLGPSKGYDQSLDDGDALLRHSKIRKASLVHPENIRFKPLLLDDRRHLASIK